MVLVRFVPRRGRAVLIGAALVMLLGPGIGAGAGRASAQDAATGAGPRAADPQVTEAQVRLGEARTRLQTAEAALDAAAAAYETVSAHELRLTEEAATADHRLDRSRRGVDHAAALLRARAAAAYKHPRVETAFAVVLLRTADPADALHRVELLAAAADRSAERFALAQDRTAETAELLRQERILRAGVAAAAAERRDAAAQLAATVAVARRGVAAAEGDLRQAERDAARRAAEAARRARELAAAAARDRLIAAGAVPPPVSLDGKVCPVGAPNGFIDSWGFPRPGGRRHQGVDIFAAYGTPLYAVADAAVLRVATNRLGGLTVTLEDAGGAHYYYAHLSAVTVAEGARVSAGTVVGGVGDSGNARGTPPHLHWEYRPAGGPPVNPYPLARALCRGA